MSLPDHSASESDDDSIDPYPRPHMSINSGDTGPTRIAVHNERSPLLSNSQTALTASDVKRGFVAEEEDKKQKWKRWKSIYVMYFTMFLTALTFSIVISSIWPYLLQVDYKHSTTNFLGWVVASYSIGQLIASPVLGFWADKRPTREPLIVATIINIVFNLMYSYLGAFPNDIAGWMMILARTLVGFGAGIGAVTRSYVSEATTTKERIGAMAAIGAAQALGFIIGPVLGLAFVPLGYEGVAIPAIKFRLNLYTGPGYTGALLGILNVVLLALFFREAKLVDKKSKEMAKRQDVEGQVHQYNDNPSVIPPPSPNKKPFFDILAAVASIIVFFVILSGFSVFETLLSPLTMDEFAWTKKDAVLYNNAFFAGLSVITITTLFAVKYITKKVDERIVLMVGMFLLAFAFFALIPMGNTPPKSITMSTLTDSDVNATEIPKIPVVNANLTIEPVGCRDPPQTWCNEVPRIYFSQFMVSLLILTPGYAATSVTIFSIYSKVLGPIRQGVMMGLLTAAGSLSRAVGPMVFSILYQHYGPYVTFGTIVGMMATTIVFILVCSPRLIPYPQYVEAMKRKKRKVYVQIQESQ